MLINCNKLAKFKGLMTFDLIFVTEGTLFITRLWIVGLDA